MEMPIKQGRSMRGIPSPRAREIRKTVSRSIASFVFMIILICLCHPIKAQAQWSTIGLSHATISSIAIDPLNTQTVYIGTRDYGSYYPRGIFKTTNGGTSWTEVNGGLTIPSDVESLVIDPHDTLTVYGAIYYQYPFVSSVIRITNGGESWSRIEVYSNPDFGSINSLSIYPQNMQILCALRASKAVIKSTNGGHFIDQSGVRASPTSPA
jgi:hypothetical protein